MKGLEYIPALIERPPLAARHGQERDVSEEMMKEFAIEKETPCTRRVNSEALDGRRKVFAFFEKRLGM